MPSAKAIVLAIHHWERPPFWYRHKSEMASSWKIATWSSTTFRLFTRTHSWESHSCVPPATQTRFRIESLPSKFHCRILFSVHSHFYDMEYPKPDETRIQSSSAATKATIYSQNRIMSAARHERALQEQRRGLVSSKLKTSFSPHNLHNNTIRSACPETHGECFKTTPRAPTELSDEN